MDLNPTAELLQRQLAEAKAECDRLRGLIDRDQTGLAKGLAKIVKITEGYSWLGNQGDWGSYEYDERTEAILRAEMENALTEIRTTAIQALGESGDRATAAFRPETIRQLQAEIAELKRQLEGRADRRVDGGKRADSNKHLGPPHLGGA